MKRGNINRRMKRVAVGFLSASLVMAGTLVLPKTVEAAEADTVVYEEMTMETGTVPVKTGYLFGGWYNDNAGQSAVKKGETPTGTTYAKFVPAYVLSVKAQVDAGAKAGDGATNMRILTSLDSLDYQSVGVQVGLNNANVSEYTSEKVYDNLVIGKGDNTTKAAAKEVFGTASQFFGAWKIASIADTNDDKIVYVRPFWVTMDGTKVYGLAKYVHVEDAYKNYISVPVNLMSRADTAAAGLVAMGYSSEQLEFAGVENGRVANNEMTENHSVAGIVKIVGNQATVNEYAKGESLFVNLRFKLKDPRILYTTNEDRTMTRQTFLTFGINDVDFSDWNENPVEVGAWTIRY